MTRDARGTWQRPADTRVIAGVCAGIAERTDVDVTLVRLAFLILALASGLGLAIYAGLWIAMPSPATAGRSLRERLSRPRLEAELDRTRASLGGAWRRGDAGSAWPRPVDRRWLGYAVISLGLVIVLASFGAFSWVTTPRALGLALLALGAGALLSLAGADRRHGGRR